MRDPQKIILVPLNHALEEAGANSPAPPAAASPASSVEQSQALCGGRPEPYGGIGHRPPRAITREALLNRFPLSPPLPFPGAGPVPMSFDKSPLSRRLANRPTKPEIVVVQPGRLRRRALFGADRTSHPPRRPRIRESSAPPQGCELFPRTEIQVIPS